MYSTWHNYTIFNAILLLATSFDLKRPSSGQYLKNLKLLVHIVQKRQIYRTPFTFINSLMSPETILQLNRILLAKTL